MATKARKPATPKYLYVATRRSSGEIILDGNGLAYAATRSENVKMTAVPKGETVKVVRYVLEASVRPGGN